MIFCALLAGCDKNPTVIDDSPSAPAPVATAPLPEMLSGYHFQSADTQALQDDQFANPGMLWVDRGEELWTTAPQTGKPACAGCHNDAATDMAGVAAHFPKYNKSLDTVVNLEGQINHCRVEHQQSSPLVYESDDLLALSAYVGYQSNGLPIEVAIDGPAAPAFAAGQAYFYTRRGQLNLACNHCHEDNVGRMLRGDKLSQGQAGGYPAYRLEWQSIGSLHRRLRFCNVGVRAEPFAFGATQYIELELYLKWRAQGLPVETPAVRR
ncbi:MAG: sulfur oxidation c-type cytochrome SoxA [Pseudomonadaceae bacterium]|nr:sulfur oxidation c-type cytochrome SoxA [Pseudomonadaceae bacterium]